MSGISTSIVLPGSTLTSSFCTRVKDSGSIMIVQPLLFGTPPSSKRSSLPISAARLRIWLMSSPPEKARQARTLVPARPEFCELVPSGSTAWPRMQPPSSGASSMPVTGAPAFAGSFTFGSSGW